MQTILTTISTMKNRILLITLSIIFHLCLFAQGYEWKSVPIVGGGFVDGFILHPNNSVVRYCRTDMGGAYRWDSVNNEWVQMLDWVSLAECNLQGVESIATDPTDAKKYIWLVEHIQTKRGVS